MSSLNEHLLTIDEYNRPKVLEEHEAAYTLIMRLLLMNPGTIQTHPTMGVGIVKNFRYSDASSLTSLKSTIKSQIQTFLPHLFCTEVTINAYNDILYIYINTENVTYGLSYNTETGNVGPLTLDEIKN